MERKLTQTQPGELIGVKKAQKSKIENKWWTAKQGLRKQSN
ncbi:hypothetical protein [Echinicola strongylocentroti]